MYKRFPDLNLIPIEAENLDYFRYLNRVRISSVEAAHLCAGFMPTMDCTFAFMNPHLSEAKEIHKLLIDAASANRIANLNIENGTRYASLIDWVTYLGQIQHPLPEGLHQVFMSTPPEERDYSQNKDGANSPNKLKLKKLSDEILILDNFFPKIPYRYYAYKEEIETLLKNLNMSIESFEKHASKIVKAKRASGRPPKNFLDLYEKAHPELNEWFEKIRKDLQKK